MPDRYKRPKRWDEIPSKVYEVVERLKAMDSEGTDATVVYPNITGPSGNTFVGMEAEFERECVQAYNDYVIEEFYNHAPARFIHNIVPPYSSMEATLSEIKRSAKEVDIVYLAPAPDRDVRLGVQASSNAMSCAPCHSVERPSSARSWSPSPIVRKWFPASWPTLLAKSAEPYGTRISISEAPPG